MLTPEATHFYCCPGHWNRTQTLSSRPKTERLKGSEVEWRDPDSLSHAIPHQGVLSKQFHLPSLNALLHRCSSFLAMPSRSRAPLLEGNFLFGGISAGEGSAPRQTCVADHSFFTLHKR
jgi:hypothetical protein